VLILLLSYGFDWDKPLLKFYKVPPISRQRVSLTRTEARTAAPAGINISMKADWKAEEEYILAPALMAPSQRASSINPTSI
jgi:hypothetical protein